SGPLPAPTARLDRNRLTARPANVRRAMAARRSKLTTHFVSAKREGAQPGKAIRMPGHFLVVFSRAERRLARGAPKRGGGVHAREQSSAVLFGARRSSRDARR